MRNTILVAILASIPACMTTPDSTPDAVTQCQDTVLTFCEMQRACTQPGQVDDTCPEIAQKSCAGNQTELTVAGYHGCLDELQNHSTCDTGAGKLQISDNAAACLTTYEAWLNEQPIQPGTVPQLASCATVCPADHLTDRGESMICATGSLCAAEPSCAELQTHYRGTITCTSDNNCLFALDKGRIACLGQIP